MWSDTNSIYKKSTNKHKHPARKNVESHHWSAKRKSLYVYVLEVKWYIVFEKVWNTCSVKSFAHLYCHWSFKYQFCHVLWWTDSDFSEEQAGYPGFARGSQRGQWDCPHTTQSTISCIRFYFLNIHFYLLGSDLKDLSHLLFKAEWSSSLGVLSCVGSFMLF